MRRYLSALVLLLVFSSTACCATISEQQKRDYGLLESAVTFSSDKVIGEYGDSIPSDFDSNGFMKLVKDKIPEDYYQALREYDLEVEPKGEYYLLIVEDPDTKSIILFDYSCTPEVDGPVLLEPENYDVHGLERYDTCKTN